MYGRPSTGWATLRTGTPHGVRASPAAPVCVAVDRHVGLPAIDGLGEQVAAEEGEDLRSLTLQRLRHRRVVGEGDADVALQRAERCRKGIGHLPGAADEGLHQSARRTPSAGRAEEATAEAGRAGDADAHAVDVDRGALAVEHGGAGGLDDVAHLLGGIALVVVVAEHRDDREAIQCGQLTGEHLGFCRGPDAG